MYALPRALTHLYIQIELDKTATSFRQAHTEREGLIQQWEHTIDQMKRRDADMDRCAVVTAHLSSMSTQSSIYISLSFYKGISSTEGGNKDQE